MGDVPGAVSGSAFRIAGLTLAETRTRWAALRNPPHHRPRRSWQPAPRPAKSLGIEGEELDVLDILLGELSAARAAEGGLRRPDVDLHVG